MGMQRWIRCWCSRVISCFRKQRVLAAVIMTLTLLLRTRSSPPPPSGSAPDLVAEAERQLAALPELAGPAEAAAAALFSRLRAALTETAPRGRLCRSRAQLGGWCAWCMLLSTGADAVDWAGSSDGAKTMCLDLLPPEGGRPCRVLSVGINNDFSFDRAAVALGCRVDAFDPTMATPTQWVAERLLFHPVGLAAAEGVARDDDGRPLPLRTLAGLLRLAGLPRGVVDYVKLDIENSEWTVLEALLARGGGPLRRVRQLTIEFHLDQWQPQLEGQLQRQLTRSNARRFLRTLLALQLAGFQLVETKPYEACTKVPGGWCIPWIYETLWVNVRPSSVEDWDFGG